MKAIIMAGGEGSRLRPLTCDCPKPMLHLLGRPLMEYAIRLLKAHGITEISATLGYLPDVISDYFGDGGDLGVQLRYFVEKQPLGTAGSVRRAVDETDERLLVLSGDGITDFDLSRALAFHAARGAAATLILKKSGTPQEYGMVVTGPDGRIRSFHEKPGRFDVYSDLINTGIYILEPEAVRRIPEEGFCDFGHDLFPALLREGLPLFGCVLDGYWCDVGDIRAYLDVQADALSGRIHLDGLRTDPREIINEGALIDPGCRIEGPCYLAAGVRLHSGVRIHPYTVLEENCTVFPGADLKRSVLLSGARVDSGAQLRGCVLGVNASAGEYSEIYEDCVVGTLSRVGERAILMPGVKLWPDKQLPDGERLDSNLVWGQRRSPRFSAGGMELSSPAQAARAAEACVSELRPRELLLGHGASPVAGALWHAAASGAMAQGVQIVDAGLTTLPQLRFAQRSLHADAAMLVEERQLIPLARDGVRLSERVQRGIIKLCERQDYSGPFCGVTPQMLSAGRTDVGYIAHAAACFQADARCAPPVAVFAESGRLLTLAERAFTRAGLSVRAEWLHSGAELKPGETGVYLDSGGEHAVLADAQRTLDEAQMQLLCAWVALEAGQRRLILPMGGTRAVERLAEARGARCEYVAGEPSAWMQALCEASPAQFELNLDGLCLSLTALSLLTDRGLSLSKWLDGMPKVCRRTRSVPVSSAETGRILHILADREPDAQLGGGVRFPRSDGWACLCPDDARPELKIVAEAMSSEIADELCGFYERELSALLAAEHPPAAAPRSSIRP